MPRELDTLFYCHCYIEYSLLLRPLSKQLELVQCNSGAHAEGPRRPRRLGRLQQHSSLEIMPTMPLLLLSQALAILDVQTSRMLNSWMLIVVGGYWGPVVALLGVLGFGVSVQRATPISELRRPLWSILGVQGPWHQQPKSQPWDLPGAQPPVGKSMC